MQQVSQALNEIKDLYTKVLGKPAPEIQPGAYVAFPPGVDPLKHAVHEVEQLKQMSEKMTFAPRAVAWIPRADTFMTDDEFVVVLDVPGVARDDLKVFVSGGECVVRGERKLLEEKSELRPMSFERDRGPFERRFVLPPGSYPDRIKARCHDGVLEVRVGVEAATPPKETKVEAD